MREKRHVGNTYGHLGTRLISDVTSATSPLAKEGVKDGDGQAKLASYNIKIKGENVGLTPPRQRGGGEIQISKNA